MQSSKFKMQKWAHRLSLHLGFCLLHSQRSERCRSRRQQQSGYLLLVLLIAVTLLSIAAAAAAPSIAQQIKRDREDELIRRGKQYAEAVKRYYVKFHRYPANIDQLVDTNGIRFLRRRYVDPVTGKDDWKLVHQGEATIPNFQFGAGPGIPGGQTPGQIGSSPTGMAGVNPAAGAGMATGGVTTGLAGATGATTSSTTQGTTTGSTGTGGAAGTTGNAAGATVQVRPGVGGILVAELVSNASNTAGESNSQGSNQTGSGNASTGTLSSNTSTGSQSSSTSPTGTGGTFGGQQSGSTFGGQQSGSTFGGAQSGSTFGGAQSGSGFGTGGASPFANSFGAGQQIGGGAIIGVVSTSTQQSIREFNGKDHYNEWAFIYDPRLDTRVPGQTGAGGVGTPIAPGQNAGAPATQFGQGTTTPPPTTSPTTTTQPPP
jgi:type II secretory pathway pseudopilin PulG